MMGKDRISVEKQKQIELLLKRGLSLRKISESLKMCRRTVRRYTKKSASKGHIKAEVKAQPAPEVCFEAFVPTQVWAKNLDWNELVRESCSGVPTKTLFDELPVKTASYWAFWSTLKRAISVIKPEVPETTLKLIHKPGERAHVDYCDGLDFVDPKTGEVISTQLFVITFPFSSKIYAEFSFNQKLMSFIRSHENAWKAIGGVPEYLVPDNLKSAVTRADIYDPDVNKTFCDFANHYGFAVLPAKPLTPKHKASVETSVGVLQRGFYPKVRNQVFSSLREMNEALKEHVEQLNDEVMKEHGVSRNDRFEKEIPFLKPLPLYQFEFTQWKTLKVHPDCHIQCLKSFYSVPWIHVGKVVRVKVTDSAIEVFDLNSLDRVVLHQKSKKDYARITNELHYPPEKVAAASFTIEIAKKQAYKIGPNLGNLLDELFELGHPLRFLRPAQGWLRLHQTEKYTTKAIEYAASMTSKHKLYNSRYFKSCCSHFDRNGEHSSSNVTHLSPKRNNYFSHLHSKD